MPGTSELDKRENVVMTAGTLLRGSGERLPRLMLWAILLVVLIGVAGLGIWSLITQRPMVSVLTGQSGPQLPVYGVVPAFALMERSGQLVRLEDLHGKVWIASFIFTHCPDECPLMTAEMARLQADFAMASDLRLVSITVDPDRDTPAVLSDYAAHFQADPQRWLFLTGEKRAIHQLAREGFRLGINAPAETSQGAFLTPAQAWADHGRVSDIGHSARFVLVDRQGRIRGYYDSRDDLALQRLRRHVQSLLRDT